MVINFGLDRAKPPFGLKIGPNLALCVTLLPYVHISDTQTSLRNVYHDGSWDLRGLYTMIPPELVTTIMQTPAPTSLDHRLEDAWTWNHDKNGVYSCSSGYAWLLQQNRDWDANCDTRWIWRLKAPAKLQHFLWLCYHNALPTNARRHTCNMAASPCCTRCSSPVEDLYHLLRDCPHSKEIWMRFGFGVHHNFFSESDHQVWLHSMVDGPSSILFMACLWFIWCWRNNSIFETNHWKLKGVIRMIHTLHDECITHYPHKDVNLTVARLVARWIPPPLGVLKLNVDGSFLVGNAHLGAGGVIRDHTGKWIFGFTHFEMGGDALLAELRAIQLGLEMCLTLGYRDFTCECDCLEAVSLVPTSNSQVLHCYASTLLKISDAMAACGNVKLTHILRDQNVVADFMAKEGAHSSTSAHWYQPPPGVDHLLLLDVLRS